MLINIDMLHNSHNNCVDNCDAPKMTKIEIMLIGWMCDSLLTDLGQNNKQQQIKEANL